MFQLDLPGQVEVETLQGVFDERLDLGQVFLVVTDGEEKFGFLDHPLLRKACTEESHYCEVPHCEKHLD